MSEELIREYIKQIVERAEDSKSIDLAKDAFNDIVKFLKNIQGKTLQEFDQYFEKENGRYTTLKLHDISNVSELKDVFLVIKDRTTFGIRKGLKALSAREMKRVHRKGGGYQRKYWISIFIDLDRTLNWSAYNKTFRETIYDKFLEGDNWEHFVHEFTHILDFQRQADEYLLTRSKKISSRKSEREKDENFYMNTYVNDPGESNAYIRQSLARIEKMLESIESDDEFFKILGRSQREFVEKFMDEYLVRIAKRRFSEDNKLRAVKRAMAFYERAIQRHALEAH